MNLDKPLDFLVYPSGNICDRGCRHCLSESGPIGEYMTVDTARELSRQDRKNVV